jgi:hypothetical protein
MIKKILFFALVLVTSISLNNALAQDDTLPGQPTTIEFQLTNPLDLPDDASLIDVLNMIVDAAMYIAIPVIVILIIYTGLKFVMAQGNETKIKEAKQMFYYVIIGTAIILGAKVLVSIVENTMGALNTEETT